MDTNYLEEAFKRLSLLEDDFDISVDANKVDELKSFIDDDVDEIPEEEIIDVNADEESELQDNYIGKVILECECCHSRIYKDEADVIIDEESGLANVDEQCPVCNNELGYTVIGKIEPFDKDREIEPEEETDEVTELPADDVDVEEVEETEEVEESLSNRIARKHLREQKDDVCPNCGKNPCECEDVDESCGKKLKEEFEDPDDLGIDPDAAVEDDVKLETPFENPVDDDPNTLNEGIENLVLDTEDQHLEMQAGDDGKVTVTTEPVENANEDWQEPGGELLDEPEDAEAGAEEIVPLEPEEEAEIEANEPEEVEGEEEVAEEPVEEVGEEEVAEEEPAEDEEELDIEDFDEESFDEMGESYMRKVYGNISNYKTTKINESNNSIVVEGLITFESGKTKPTRFVFENASLSKRGKLVLEGYNKTFTKASKAFMVRGSLVEKKYIPESLIYNYKVKQLNESTNSDETVRVYGRIKKK